MIYKVERNEHYDYVGQSYASMYPNLHRYPATMIPQIGIDILKEFDAQSGVMLDPYCGSGSSFICGLECGITEMHGFDLNPLAVLIAQAKFTKISSSVIEQSRDALRENVFEILKDPRKIAAIAKPEITNITFWFSPAVIEHLAVLKHCIDNLSNKSVRTLFSVPFSETVRECSYTRNNEFKLYRIEPEEILAFNPDVMSFYFKKLDETIFYYKNFYLPKLTNETRVTVTPRAFENDGQEYDVVLTSPPYGDSRTTVAYGQFSTLSNEWLGIKEARKIDARLMGGAKAERILSTGCMAEPLRAINAVDKKRALEVSAFYADLESSIQQVAASVKKGGKAIYIVGNRKVKNTELPTDQFIAEEFEAHNFKHLITYKRLLSNKAMPSRNSPTNVAGKTENTMLFEFIVVCEKARRRKRSSYV